MTKWLNHHCLFLSSDKCATECLRRLASCTMQTLEEEQRLRNEAIEQRVSVSADDLTDHFKKALPPGSCLTHCHVLQSLEFGNETIEDDATVQQAIQEVLAKVNLSGGGAQAVQEAAAPPEHQQPAG